MSRGEGDDVSDAILSFYDALNNAMYIAELEKMRVGGYPPTETTPASQPRKTEEDAEHDEKRRYCVYPGHSALRITTVVRGAGAGNVPLISVDIMLRNL